MMAQALTDIADSDSVNLGSNPGPIPLRIFDSYGCRNSPDISARYRPGERIGANQRRQTPGCGAGTAAGSLKAVFESSDVERFAWVLMEV